MGKSTLARNDFVILKLIKDEKMTVKKDGRILRNGKEIGSDSHSRGGKKRYRKILYDGKLLYAHRIVWAAYGGKLSSFLQINHKDKDGTNNEISNLELVTPSENVIHGNITRVRGIRRGGMSAAEARKKWIEGRKRGNDGKING